jgi:DNA-binding transcriptional MerR regulator
MRQTQRFLANLDSITVMCKNTVMIETQQGLTLDELSNEVERELRERHLIADQPDHRVSAKPDARTIRYYTTLGLLDRATIRGRQAYYGRRHVLQLCAIKALQLTSLPLSEIQTHLYGMSDTELDTVVGTVATRIPELKSEKQDKIRHKVWREIIIEPGLKIMAEEGWKPTGDHSSIHSKIMAALAALQVK